MDAGRVRTHPPVTDVFEIPDRAALTRHEGQHFAQIETGAAAKGHHAIEPSRAIGFERGIKVLARRIGVDG